MMNIFYVSVTDVSSSVLFKESQPF